VFKVLNKFPPSVPSDPPPKVSVAMVTYNHEKFITQAIESVLMQDVNFPIELIIGEDCSTDGTRAIVKRYAEARPDIIRALFRERNLGASENFREVIAACRGEYIAYLEGDDYWTAPEKLQRQVELMEAGPEMALCHHTVDFVSWEGGCRKVLKTFPPASDRGPRHARDLIGNNFIQSCSLMVRRSCLPAFDARSLALKIGDWPLCYLAAERGGIGFLDLKMADYRIHGSNGWHASDYIGRRFEEARMSLYLADVAQPWAQAAWRHHAVNLLSMVLGNQPTYFGATRKASAFWRSGCLSLPQTLWLLVCELVKRPLRRHPKAVAALKRVLQLIRLRRQSAQ
jgi:glycosyltransferase involved in cell wall biosynthesis